jgi:hypothetical protein
MRASPVSGTAADTLAAVQIINIGKVATADSAVHAAGSDKRGGNGVGFFLCHTIARLSLVLIFAVFLSTG